VTVKLKSCKVSDAVPAANPDVIVKYKSFSDIDGRVAEFPMGVVDVVYPLDWESIHLVNNVSVSTSANRIPLTDLVALDKTGSILIVKSAAVPVVPILYLIKFEATGVVVLGLLIQTSKTNLSPT
jgi:hypothetical protein